VRLSVGSNHAGISRDRWVHHTSFLWDFDERNMELLTLPSKRPAYRRDRGHSSFLHRLRASAPSIDALEASLVRQLRARYDVVEDGAREAAEAVEALPQERKSNVWVDLSTLPRA
jgi:lipoate-protein ligase A